MNPNKHAKQHSADPEYFMAMLSLFIGKINTEGKETIWHSYTQVTNVQKSKETNTSVEFLPRYNYQIN